MVDRQRRIPSAVELGLDSVSSMPEGDGRKEAPSHFRYGLVVLDFHGTMTDHQLRTIRAHDQASKSAFGRRHSPEFFFDVLTRPSVQKSKAGSSEENPPPPQTNREFVIERFGRIRTEEEVARYLRVFQETMNTTYIPIPGMIRAVRKLLEEGVEIAMLTNGNDRECVSQILQNWNLHRLAGDRLYSSHITGRKKPHPQSITAILDDLKIEGIDVPRDRILVVGDYKDDIEAAANVGVDSALMVRPRGGEPLTLSEPKPTYVVTDAIQFRSVIVGEHPPVEGEVVDIPPSGWLKTMAKRKSREWWLDRGLPGLANTSNPNATEGPTQIFPS